ncbi:MAG: hypothetical protein Q7R83_01255 [bacterium]|nr:hypothetical protein [bacterium]
MTRNEAVASSYGDPAEFRAKPISRQIDILAGAFGLSLGLTAEYVEKSLPKITLPNDADGFFAIPSVDAVAKRHFPKVQDPVKKYCRCVELVIELTCRSKVHNHHRGELPPEYLRQNPRTLHALDQIAEKQPGNILVVPAQFGMRRCGKAMRHPGEVFTSNEFGLGAFAVGCMLLTHPERLVKNEDLWIYCPGDEYAYEADFEWGVEPVWHWKGSELTFHAYWVNCSDRLASVSAFFPKG